MKYYLVISKMELEIDTASSEKIIIGIEGKKFETSALREKSQKLLPFIVTTLRKNKLKVNDIKSIKVASGPGSFTGIRVGVSIASALGWVLGVPVNGKDIRKGESVEINYG